MEMHVSYTPGQIHLIPMVPGATPIQNWSLVTVEAADGTRTKHIIGRADNEGRYSTALVMIDWASRTVQTKSGRIYELIGPPGNDDDAQWIMGMAHMARGDTFVKNHFKAIQRLLLAMGKAHA